MSRIGTYPANAELESVVDRLLPNAILSGGGIFEQDANIYEIAFDALNAEKMALQGTRSLTAYGKQTEQMEELTWIPFAHPLIQSYADQIIDEAPVEILSFSSSRKIQPQRVLEKLAGTFHTRPQKQELISVTEDRRLWVHSLFLLNLESFDRGHKVTHLLQNSDGAFLPQAQQTIQKLENRMLEFDLETLERIPQSLEIKWNANLESDMFFAEFRGEISNMKRDELWTAKKYFAALTSDLENRIHKIKMAPYLGGRRSSSAEAKKSLDGLSLKLEKVKSESEQRLAAIEERYQSRFSVQPIGSRIYVLPVFHCQIRVGDVSRGDTITIDYCPVLREFFSPTCPTCNEAAWDLVLKTKQLVCGKCAGG
jgi:hypothetical protein